MISSHANRFGVICPHYEIFESEIFTVFSVLFHSFPLYSGGGRGFRNESICICLWSAELMRLISVFSPSFTFWYSYFLSPFCWKSLRNVIKIRWTDFIAAGKLCHLSPPSQIKPVPAHTLAQKKTEVVCHVPPWTGICSSVLRAECFSGVVRPAVLLELLGTSRTERLGDRALMWSTPSVWERVLSCTCWKQGRGDVQRRDRQREGGRVRGQIRKWSSHNNTDSPVTQFQVKPRCMKNFVELL